MEKMKEQKQYDEMSDKTLLCLMRNTKKECIKWEEFLNALYEKHLIDEEEFSNLQDVFILVLSSKMSETSTCKSCLIDFRLEAETLKYTILTLLNKIHRPNPFIRLLMETFYSLIVFALILLLE